VRSMSSGMRCGGYPDSSVVCMMRLTAANTCSSNSLLMRRNFSEHRTRPKTEIAIRILEKISTRLVILRQAESHVNPGFYPLEIEVCPKERVIRGAGSTARFDIHRNFFASLGQGPRRKNVIDAPAFVLVERARAEIVPKRELLSLGIQLAKDVNKAPRRRIFVC